MFPTGVKVEIVRNGWGIDVTIFTNRAVFQSNESGLCLYNGDLNDQSALSSFGELQRYVF